MAPHKPIRPRLVIITGLLLLAVALPTGLMSYRYREHRTINVDHHLPGYAYATLPTGLTHYALQGPRRGATAVLIHGTSIASWTFADLSATLHAQQYRTLRYDALGRGHSERPATPLSRQLLRDQLHQLLQALNITPPVILVGHSLGGALAVDFAVHHPNTVSSVVLIAPVVNHVTAGAPYLICGLPLVSRPFARISLIPALRKRNQAQWNAAHPAVDTAHYDKLFMMQASFIGFADAICSLFQGDAVTDYRDTYAQLGRTDIPVLLVWGDGDTSISRENITDALAHLPASQYIEMPGIGHAPHAESQESFNALLLDFLRQHPAPTAPEALGETGE